jgi:UDP-N-acetylmuramyl pentapeptide phosphotransferase/UDP-N-acetylglucosamine-1-phosphate transferase
LYAVELFRIDAVLAGLVSLLVATLLVCTKDWHGRFSMDSTEGVQKFHTSPTPRIGGVAIALGVIVGYAVSSHDPAAADKRAILGGIILAGVPAFVFGLLEDLTKRVSVLARLLATMASGVLGWGITGVSVTHVALPGVDWLLGFTFISVLFTAFAVGGIANAVNIIDGFNGLAAGCVLIMLTAFGFIARAVVDIPLAFSCLVIAGAVLGFSIVNWPLGKIFLGDGGAYFVGFALAWIAVLLPHRNPSVSPWTSLLICAYPILEVVFSYVRKSKREGHHPGQPDRVHFHMLVYRRVARKLLINQSQPIQNGLTSPFIWLYAALPAAVAVVSFDSGLICTIAMGLTALMYSIIYRRLVLFKWFR